MLPAPSSTLEAPTLVLADPLMIPSSYPSSQASHPWGPTRLLAPASGLPGDNCALLLRHSGGKLTTQSCPTLCNPVDCSPPGSSVHGMLQGRTRQLVVFSRGSPQPRDQIQVSCIAGRFFTV